MTVPYLTAGEIATVPGRLSELWGKLASAEQDLQLDLASGEVDRITGQDGGLWTQTGKIYESDRWSGGTRITLPNFPITAVTAVRVTVPADGSAPFDVTGFSWSASRQTVDLFYAGAAYRRLFSPGDVVRVTYTCGIVAEGGDLPAAIKTATRLILSENLFGPIDNPAGLRRVTGLGGEVELAGRRHIDRAVELLAPWTCA